MENSSNFLKEFEDLLKRIDDCTLSSSAKQEITLQMKNSLETTQFKPEKPETFNHSFNFGRDSQSGPKDSKTVAPKNIFKLALVGDGAVGKVCYSPKEDI